MNVLQVNKFYHPEIGGIETVCRQYSNFLSEENKVIVLTVKKEFSLFDSKDTVDDTLVIRCASLGTFLSMPISLSFFYRYYKLVKWSDVVLLHMPFPLVDMALFFTRCLGKKFVLVWHSDIIKQGLVKKLLSPFLKASKKRAARILVTSPNMRDNSLDLIDYRDKISVLPLSIEVKTDIFPVDLPDIRDFRKSVVPENFDGFFFGRLCYYKGIEFLMKSILELKNTGSPVKVVIAGKGEYEDYIANFIKENDLDNTYFINRFLSEKEKEALFLRSSFFLFPSVKDSEAFGITQLEAMVYKKPVINTYLNTGVPWVSLHGETGLTVPVNDVDALVSAIIYLYENKYETMRLGENARRRVIDIFDNNVIKRNLTEIVSDF
ncbi:glycosyltransferase [Vibrio nigripulchritudo]|uniref:glycosyltransferase n=1 Tax=Vibrio nigripulchritudo TaxID=28173 RepID=UPI0005F9AB69|nr:glycosyltransferase [Vibrio nigripulchritudo]KJY79058.1 hypothetical protein TW74_10225 [Vibrio nigripulchritudo]